MVKMNFKNNSVALGYAAYMMIGSYFNKCICPNNLQESKFYVAYCEAGQKLQFKLEDNAERYALKKIFSKNHKNKDSLVTLLNLSSVEDLANENVSVTLKSNDEYSTVVFSNDSFTLKVHCKFTSGLCEFRHSVTVASPEKEATDCSDNSSDISSPSPTPKCA